jgi:hypothetical protein
MQGSFWSSHIALRGFANLLPMIALMFQMFQISQLQHVFKHSIFFQEIHNQCMCPFGHSQIKICGSIDTFTKTSKTYET